MIMAVLNYLDDVLYYPILMVILIAAGLIFSWKTRCVQLRLLPESIRVVMEKPTEAGKVSSFQALMVSTASRVGTGNIIGVSTAICLGGPGAVFWMWLLAIIGGATAFIESTLAQIYKRRNPLGHSYGGPAYYIETAMHKRWLGVLFAFSLILTYAGGFNLLCSFNMQSTFLVYSFYDPTTTPWIIGAVFAALVAYCLVGGGVSTESGIPDFRSTDGLYNQHYKYPPETILSHSFFMDITAGVWVRVARVVEIEPPWHVHRLERSIVARKSSERNSLRSYIFRI